MTKAKGMICWELRCRSSLPRISITKTRVTSSLVGTRLIPCLSTYKTLVAIAKYERKRKCKRLAPRGLAVHEYGP